MHCPLRLTQFLAVLTHTVRPLISYLWIPTLRCTSRDVLVLHSLRVVPLLSVLYRVEDKLTMSQTPSNVMFVGNLDGKVDRKLVYELGCQVGITGSVFQIFSKPNVHQSYNMLL